MLVAVADKLRAVVRRTDVAARYGGDEFVIVCEGPRARDDAAILADRLLGLIPGAYPLSWNTPGDGPDPSGPARLIPDRLRTARIGASIGVAVTTVPISAQALLQAADEAMYEAKHAGGNRQVTRYLPEATSS